MDAGDFISAASALVAAAAAVVGWWQAHSARRAVKAAEEQVNVMRDQVALERSLRDDSIRPRFEVTHTTAMRLRGGEGRLAVEVTQTTGVPLDDVKVELYAGSRQVMPDESDNSVYTCLYSAPGSKITVRAHLDAETAQASAIRVELSGTEARGTRRWAERLVAHPAVTDSGSVFTARREERLRRRMDTVADTPWIQEDVTAVLRQLDETQASLKDRAALSHELLAQLVEGDIADRNITSVIESLLFPDLPAHLLRQEHVPPPGVGPDGAAPAEVAPDDVPPSVGTGPEDDPDREIA